VTLSPNLTDRSSPERVFRTTVPFFTASIVPRMRTGLVVCANAGEAANESAMPKSVVRRFNDMENPSSAMAARKLVSLAHPTRRGDGLQYA
jgi:hypothetical protein